MATVHPPTGTAQTKRWTRDEYQRLGELGMFGPEDRLELIEGEIIQVTPQSSRHATTLLRASEALQRRLSPGSHLRMQLPLALSPYSQPEPDLAVVEGDIDDYEDGHPSSALLVIEISEQTLAYDRETKARLYASAGIPEFWIVNLVNRHVEVYQNPETPEESLSGPGYRSRKVLRRDESLTLPGSDETLAVSEIMP